MRIDRDAILTAEQRRREYAKGKANLEQRIVDNEEWFRQQHWRNRGDGRKRRQTAWLHATIVNKHADFMDNRPAVTVLPRERSDEEAAKQLSEILPVVLKRAGWDTSYNRCCYDKLAYGCGVYAVRWDPNADEGLGEIRITRSEALNMYWEPGVEDIQESSDVYLTELIDHETLREMYPRNKDLRDRLSAPTDEGVKYRTDESIDTSGKSLVVSWYYKRNVNGRKVLHYCRYVQDIVLYASEDDDVYKDTGWYADGRYPFVTDTMFPEPGTWHGFGIIDTSRETQEDIDELNDLAMRNAKVASRRRYFIRADAGINEEEFLDEDTDLVHIQGSINEANVVEIRSEPYSTTYVAMLENKIQELKENAYARDVTTGGGSTDTAAGIAALIETGSKASRDSIQQTYRAFELIIDMVIERIRQFYTTPRVFRIVGDDKQVTYQTFDAGALRGRPIGAGIDTVYGDKRPVFDLDVRVSKQNAWSRDAQNQQVLNFYGMGFFDPQRSTSALACLEALDLDNKDKLEEVIRTNGTREQFIQQFLPLLLQSAMAFDPQLGMSAAQAAQAAGILQQTPQGGTQASVPETQMDRSRAYMDKQRALTAARTAPQA